MKDKTIKAFKTLYARFGIEKIFTGEDIYTTGISFKTFDNHYKKFGIIKTTVIKKNELSTSDIIELLNGEEPPSLYGAEFIEENGKIYEVNTWYGYKFTAV